MTHQPNKLVEPSPFDKFRKLADTLVRVPKSEADKKEAEYQKRKERKKKSNEK